MVPIAQPGGKLPVQAPLDPQHFQDVMSKQLGEYLDVGPTQGKAVACGIPSHVTDDRVQVGMPVELVP